MLLINLKILFRLIFDMYFRYYKIENDLIFILLHVS